MEVVQARIAADFEAHAVPRESWAEPMEAVQARYAREGGQLRKAHVEKVRGDDTSPASGRSVK
jgi:stringent starvation protein B